MLKEIMRTATIIAMAIRTSMRVRPGFPLRSVTGRPHKLYEFLARAVGDSRNLPEILTPFTVTVAVSPFISPISSFPELTRRSPRFWKRCRSLSKMW